MNKKLYKNSEGKWKFDGGTIPAGKFYYIPLGDIIVIKDGNDVIFRDAVTRLTRENGTPYEDIETFDHEVGDFFVKAPIDAGAIMYGVQRLRGVADPNFQSE